MALFPGAKLMQGKEWGYPQGAPRPVPPSGKAFSVIHITGNSRLPSAEGEATWRINDPANQNSATFFVNRDGSVVQFLADPLHMDPWSNGDVNQPDTSNPRIKAVLDDGVNANERTIVAIENVGFEPGSSLTDAQIKSCAEIVAHYHKATGVPVNRQTVIGHYQLNSVTRPNCPAKDKSVLDKIVAQAQEGVEDPMEIARLKARVRELEQRRDTLLAQIQMLETQLADAADNTTDEAELRRMIRGLRDKVAAIKDFVADA